ncbi:MAG: YkvA family protein [Candidatus Woesearchaeota archaeon]
MKRIYYTFLMEELEDFRSSGEDISDIKYIPDFFKLLSDMLDRDEVDKDARLLINAALGYFVSPDDVLPDDVYGPKGYMDDIFVCTFVLQKLYLQYSTLMRQLWNNEEELKTAIENTYSSSKRYLEEQNLIERIIRYCGLD